MELPSKKVFVAAGTGDAQAVAAWLDDGGGTVFGITSLMAAAACGGQDARVQMLLQRGASVNLQNPVDGCTVLMGAAAGGHTATVRVLLDAKADASLQDVHGATALMWAEQLKQTATA